MVAKKEKLEKAPEDTRIAFTKAQIASSRMYQHNRDVVNVVLKDDKTYTLKEVDERIEKFMTMKEKVK